MNNFITLDMAEMTADERKLLAVVLGLMEAKKHLKIYEGTITVTG